MHAIRLASNGMLTVGFHSAQTGLTAVSLCQVHTILRLKIYVCARCFDPSAGDRASARARSTNYSQSEPRAMTVNEEIGPLSALTLRHVI